VEHEPLSNPQHEAFARYVAEGKSHREAAISAGFSKKSASSQGSQLAKRLNIAKRIAFLQGQVAETRVQLACKNLELSIGSRVKRIEMYEDVHERLWQIVKERAADPAMENVPGGRSGMLVKQVKIVSTAEGPKVISEYVPDTALSKEIRALAQQAAEEPGQWRDDSKPVTSNHVEYYWADPPAVDVEPVKTNEADDNKQLKFPSVM
jgi:phage terminase small subunit